jgi:hypothetical protein
MAGLLSFIGIVLLFICKTIAHDVFENYATASDLSGDFPVEVEPSLECASVVVCVVSRSCGTRSIQYHFEFSMTSIPFSMILSIPLIESVTAVSTGMSGGIPLPSIT